MKPVFAAVAVFLLAAAAQAQVDRATVSGVVKDASGAVIPGGSVTVTNAATNVGQQARSPPRRPIRSSRRAAPQGP